MAGYTTLIYEMKQVLSDLVRGHFIRTQVIDHHAVQQEKELNEMSKGTIRDAEDYIFFDKIPIISPNGDVLVKELSFEMRRG